LADTRFTISFAGRLSKRTVLVAFCLISPAQSYSFFFGLSSPPPITAFSFSDATIGVVAGSGVGVAGAGGFAPPESIVARLDCPKNIGGDFECKFNENNRDRQIKQPNPAPRTAPTLPQKPLLLSACENSLN
jgi:hypothetical protein